MCVRHACSAVVRYPGLQAVLVYRFGRMLLGWTRRPWWWPLLPLASVLYLVAVTAVRACYGIHLFQSAQIGSGFSILHFGGIEIANCRLGKRCSVGQQTKVGSRSNPCGPEVGDGVWIGGHAKVLGPVSIGDGATIAPAARVTKPVPKNAFVVGDPARIIFPSYDNQRIQPRG